MIHRLDGAAWSSPSPEIARLASNCPPVSPGVRFRTSRRPKDSCLKTLRSPLPDPSLLGIPYGGVPAHAVEFDADARGPFRIGRGTFPHRRPAGNRGHG